MTTPASPLPIGELQQTSREQGIADYAAFLSGQFSPTLAQEFESFAAQPAYAHQTAFNTLHAFAVFLSGAAVGQSAKEVFAALGKASAQEAQGVGKGAAIAGKNLTAGLLQVPQFLGLISSRAFVIRAVKVLVGTVLVVIGLAELTGASKIASKIPAVIPV